ncbi:MAG: CRISPR-associated helicase Cas3' [Rubripirellula sp.]
MTIYAHTLPGETNQKFWETISDHEQQVADRCRDFLTRIDPELAAWGDLLGRWHDIGKYSKSFQAYLNQAGAADDVHVGEVTGQVDHSTAAAKLICDRDPKFGKLFAYILAGHHAGLPDWDVGSGRSGLKSRLDKVIDETWRCDASQTLAAMEVPRFPVLAKISPDETIDKSVVAAFRVSFFVRMMFSALVDADFLATEAFMSPSQASERQQAGVAMATLSDHLEVHLGELSRGSKPSAVNTIRAEVSDLCRAAAERTPGLYSLNVPTGGGKTLASLRFALRHAAANQMDGVVVAIPFTSIIEQNAAVYRDLFDPFGREIVLEHHSNLNPDDASETTAKRLQTENWDAPIVVTTNVQLFESMFACRTSRCRKLHRIARRVIVLDEVQSLPVELLTPTMLAIRELVQSYHCTVVLCTATQPAIGHRENFPIGLHDVQPIIPDINSLHDRLRRVNVHRAGELTDEELVGRLDSDQQVLCIVNTRPHAAKIFAGLRTDSGNFHLSTRMCAAHRLFVLNKKIRPRLKLGRRCRVVSTQLIEAGVDVDFPVVYRAICGLDSLAQAAGRCNREGRRESGEVYFFESEQAPPPGMLRQAADSARELLSKHPDLLSPAAIEEYFQLHYFKRGQEGWDKREVMQAIGRSPRAMQFRFREISDRYRFITEVTETIVVPWGKGKRLIKKLRNEFEPPTRDDWRRLQRYTVSVRDHELRQLLAAGALEKMHDCWVLAQPHLYDEAMGLTPQLADGVLPVDDLIG